MGAGGNNGLLFVAHLQTPALIQAATPNRAQMISSGIIFMKS
jgi:hypothetical protein